MKSVFRRVFIVILTVIFTVTTLLTGCAEKPDSDGKTPPDNAVGDKSDVNDGGAEDKPDDNTGNSAGGSVNVEEIMDKTPEDFKGNDQLVVLGENEEGKENFYVYAEDVEHIISDKGENVVVNADTENGVYTVQNPSAELLNLEKGDVFVIPSTPESPMAAAVKIESVTEGEDNTVTYVSADLVLEDIYDYAYVKTPLYAYSMWVDESSLGENTSVELFGYTDDPSNRVELSATGTDGYLFNDKVDWKGTLKAGASFSYGTDISLGKGFVNGLYHELHYRDYTTYELTDLTAEFYFNPHRGYIHLGVNFNSAIKNEASYAYEGGWRNGINGMGNTFPVTVGVIPNLMIPYAMELFASVEISGGVVGRTTITQSYVSGAAFDVYNYSQTDCYGFSDLVSETKTVDNYINGKVEAYAGARLSFGVPSILALYGEVGVFGVRLEGKLSEIDGAEDGPDSVHDCERCIDGELTFFSRVRVGFVVGLGGPALTGNFDLAEIKVSGDVFYVSLKNEAIDGFEFGWGECPYRRYRTLITVLDEDANRTPGAEVIAKYPDGRSESAETDEDGEATVYLPNGDNLVGAKYMGQTGSTHVPVDGKPTSAVINMEAKTRLFINYPDRERGNDTDNYPEFLSELESLFPDAEFVSTRWYSDLISDGTLQPGDILLDVRYDAPEQSYGEWLDPYLEDGDDSNVWGESGGWVYIEARRVCINEWGDPTSNYYFSYNVTYEGPYKAYHASPKPVADSAHRVSVDIDASMVYDAEFRVTGFGDEFGSQIHDYKEWHPGHPYSSDINSIRSLPAQRSFILGKLGYLVNYVQFMMEGGDLRQELPPYELGV